jgi:alpha-L-arabinofuranosidase
VTQSELIAVSIFDANTPDMPISYANPDTAAAEIFFQSGNQAWTRHNFTLRIAAYSASPAIAISLIHPGTGDTRTLLIDEVRLSRANPTPQIKASVSTAIVDLGIHSMRWPGGRVGDSFHWKSSIGPLSARGEEQGSNSYQTPSFGLHEFLDFCETKNLTPVLQVSFQNGADDAADLTEYVLGDASTPQGAIRTANGRSQPWTVSIFEIGNEPYKGYAGNGSIGDSGQTYATAARPVIAAIKAKSASLGKTVKVSGIIEPTFELTDFLAKAAANPDPVYDEDRMLYYWNSQVFGPNGIGPVDILAGHFYDYLKYNPSLSEAQAFPYVMAGGALFEVIIGTKIRPSMTQPLWVTEYAVYPTVVTPFTVHTERMMDFQSGLAVGDILNSLVRMNVEGAQIYNLSQPWFGLLENPDTGNLRPSGIVFKLFTPLAGEERIPVTINNTDSVTIAKGTGNIPTGMTYPLVTATATRGASGKVHVILINRSYTDAKTVNLSFDQPISGAALVQHYESTDLTANNENGTSNVGIATSATTFGTPFTITLQAHSIVRIDMQ